MTHHEAEAAGAVDTFTLPGVDQIEGFAAEADSLVEKGEGLIEGIEKYAALLPFLAQYTPVLGEIVKGLQVADALLKHVPQPSK